MSITNLIQYILRQNMLLSELVLARNALAADNPAAY